MELVKKNHELAVKLKKLLPAAGWDVTLKLSLERASIGGEDNPLQGDTFGACYVWPPMGSTVPALSATRGPAGGVQGGNDHEATSNFVTERCAQWNRANVADGVKNVPPPSHAPEYISKDPSAMERGLYGFVPVYMHHAKWGNEKLLKKIDFQTVTKWRPDPGDPESDPCAARRAEWWTLQKDAAHETTDLAEVIGDLREYVKKEKGPKGEHRPGQMIVEAAVSLSMQQRAREFRALTKNEAGRNIPGQERTPIQVTFLPIQKLDAYSSEKPLEKRQRVRRNCRDLVRIREMEIRTGGPAGAGQTFDSPPWSAAEIPTEWADWQRNMFFYNLKMSGLYCPLATSLAVVTKRLAEAGISSRDPSELLERTAFQDEFLTELYRCHAEMLAALQITDVEQAIDKNYSNDWGKCMADYAHGGDSVTRETLRLQWDNRSVVGNKAPSKNFRKNW